MSHKSDWCTLAIPVWWWTVLSPSVFWLRFLRQENVFVSEGVTSLHVEDANALLPASSNQPGAVGIEGHSEDGHPDLPLVLGHLAASVSQELCTCSHLPDLEDAILAARREQLAIRAEVHVQDGAFMSRSGLKSTKDYNCRGRTPTLLIIAFVPDRVCRRVIASINVDEVLDHFLGLEVQDADRPVMVANCHSDLSLQDASSGCNFACSHLLDPTT
mmetsp:Transcript_62290/g.100819  ORF Transcript_62290/g.100819 Transcript_62290/m.100819 type:complete len:216 (+) Transcript_62290:4695-5342(+)